MGILNLLQTSHVVMPMNSEARDMGGLNKHMLSTTVRFFKSNIIFYMIWLIQNTSIAPTPAQLQRVHVDWHPGWPLQVILKGNLTAVFGIFWHHLQNYGYIEPSTDLSLGHAHEQWGKGLGWPQQAHALHQHQAVQFKFYILYDMIDSKHFYSIHPSSATGCTSWLTSWLTSTGHSECKFNYDFWIFLQSTIQIQVIS